VPCPHGLPIGNLTSQFLANVYLDGFDHFVKQELRVKGYVRYVDDFLLFGASRAEVRAFGEAAREYLRGLRLEIHPDKYRALRCADGVDLCGFVVRADGRVRVRVAGVRRFARRYRWMRHEAQCGPWGRVGVPPAGSGVPCEPSARGTGALSRGARTRTFAVCGAGRPPARRAGRPPYPRPANQAVTRRVFRPRI
jgi:hypothetical protein